MSPGGYISQHALRQTAPPPVNIMTDRCKNITFPQLRLGMVINICKLLAQTKKRVVDFYMKHSKRNLDRFTAYEVLIKVTVT